MHFSEKIVGLLFLLSLSACNYKVAKIDEQAISSQLSYSYVARKVFAESCTTCHGSSGGVNLETYAGVKANLADIERDVFVLGSMPKAPNPPLSAEQKQILRAWLDAGAPEFSAGGAELTPEPVIEPKFASIKVMIFQKKCFSCHNAGGEAMDVPLDTPEDILNSPNELVVPGRAEVSLLYREVLADARRRMPPRDSGMSALTDVEVNAIKEWINNGARD